MPAWVWQRINAEVTLVGSPDDTALANRFDALYAVVPQDEELRRILLAHRFEVRRPASIETKHCTPARAGTKAVDGLGGTCTDTELPNPIANVVAVTPPDAVTRPERTLSDRAPKLIASNTNRRDQSANAGNVRRRGLRLRRPHRLQGAPCRKCWPRMGPDRERYCRCKRRVDQRFRRRRDSPRR